MSNRIFGFTTVCATLLVALSTAPSFAETAPARSHAQARSVSVAGTPRADAVRAAAAARAGAVRPAGPVVRHRPDGISDAEAARIRTQIQELRQMQRAARADGEVTRAEHARIKHQQQQIREMIQTAKSN